MTYEKLEEMRIRLRNAYLLGGTITVVATTVFILIFKAPELILFGLVAGLLLTMLCTKNKSREYSLAYKDFFVKKALSNIFTNLTYRPEQGISRSIIASTNMMNMGDRYNSNDLVIAQYKDTSFMQSDVHIEEKHEYRDSDGNRRTTYVTIFKGRWMIFEFNKNFKANVQVCQKGFGNNKVNTWFSETKFKKVEMESQEFNKNFKVYAQEPIDAFYILTPKIMEKIRNLDERNSGKILLCFVNNKLHVGIYDNNDSFEHSSVFKKINQEASTNSITTDIEKITMFIDELELDNDLFKKIN